MVKPKSKQEYLKLFKEMTDLMFEIAEYDDQDGQKSEYLNKAISTRKHSTDRKKVNSTPYQKHCYQCDEILTEEHLKICPGLHSLCIHCN